MKVGAYTSILWLFLQYGSFVKDGHVHLLEPDLGAAQTEGQEVGPHVVSRVELVVDYFRDAVVIQGQF